MLLLSSSKLAYKLWHGMLIEGTHPCCPWQQTHGWRSETAFAFADADIRSSDQTMDDRSLNSQCLLDPPARTWEASMATIDRQPCNSPAMNQEMAMPIHIQASNRIHAGSSPTCDSQVANGLPAMPAHKQHAPALTALQRSLPTRPGIPFSLLYHMVVRQQI